MMESTKTQIGIKTSRRDFLKTGSVAGVGIVGLSLTSGIQTVSAADQADKKIYSKEIDEGLAYFKKLAKDQMPLIIGLKDAIASGDLDKAKKAYVDCRPPYEQIETYAGSFEETDANIDARPYAFDEGTTSDEFRSVHRIEMLIFGEGDLEAALPYATKLIEACTQLQKDLENRGEFWAAKNFEGMIGLSNEVACKKISSEEETWSDQSLLIFWNNWLGIQSQIKPYYGVLSQKDTKLQDNIESAFKKCFSSIEEFYKSGIFTPYSKVSMSKRAEIVAGSNAVRDSIIAAGDKLGIM
ncbi:MAG: EfeM/EfeO family lipoprotein [Verrucomicrobiota bacterium]